MFRGTEKRIGRRLTGDEKLSFIGAIFVVAFFAMSMAMIITSIIEGPVGETGDHHDKEYAAES